MTRAAFHPISTASPANAPAFAPGAASIAAAVIVAVLVFKATSTLDPLPGWSGDPTLVAAPILGLTPAPSMIADLILCLASTAAITLGISRLASGRRIIAIVAGCTTLFLAAALPHIATARHDPHLALTLTAWIGAFAAGLAAFFLRAFPRARAILAAGAVALLAAFFARALVQYFIEQPAAYAAFKATKSSFLAAQGWTEGSPNALAYERRVSQQEASAWFGMANVLASYGAAFAACFATWSIGALTSRANPASTRARATLLACTLASIALVAMAGSKGGYAALVLGLLLASLAAWRSSRTNPIQAPRRDRAALTVGPALIALALAAIILRGLVGERVHELSLLFRYHYLVGSVRTFLESPLFGVSPTGFKDAYIRLKPPTSPEDVSSPHNVLLDLITALGIVGIAWSVLAIIAAALAGRAFLAPRSAPDPVQPREREPLAATPGARPTFLALAAGTLAAAWLESQAVTPEAALVRIIAILGGMSVAGLALRTYERAPRTFSAGLGVAAVVTLVHAQIELTWALITSAPLLAVVIGLGVEPRHEQPARAFSRLNIAVAALPGLAVAALIAFVLPNVITWERSLRRAYADVAPVAAIGDRLQALAAATRARDPIARELASELGKDLLPAAQANASFTFNDLTAAYAQFRIDRMAAALDHLAPVRDVARGYVESQRSISTLALRLALERQQAGDIPGADSAASHAVAEAGLAQYASPSSATAASWAATTLRTLGTSPIPFTNLKPPVDYRASEIASLRKAADLAPYEPSHAAWLAEAYAAQGDAANAATWAKEALRRDALLYLDPIRQFEPARRARLESLAKGATTPSASPNP